MSRLTAALLYLFLVLSGPAAAAGLIEEDASLAVNFGARHGGSLTLEALIVRPDDNQRHPLAVISHGAPRNADDRAGMHARAQLSKAREFARRGWATVVVMRRGYGQSEGEYVESSGRCDGPDYVTSGLTSAEDIRQTIAAMATKPYVDASRVISIGQSAGGFATVALTADPPPGLVAAISFAGGRGSTKPDTVCTPERLIAAFASFGKTSRIPMLWVYTDNDHFFGPRLARRFHEAFTGAGGKARFIAASDFGDDGHMLFSTKGIPIWTPYVEDFLASLRLTQFANPLPARDLAAITYPHGLTEKGRTAYRDYLDGVPHKSFAMSKDGAFGWRSNRRSTEEAVGQALEFCVKYAKQPCYTVNVDNEAAQ